MLNSEFQKIYLDKATAATSWEAIVLTRSIPLNSCLCIWTYIYIYIYTQYICMYNLQPVQPGTWFTSGHYVTRHDELALWLLAFRLGNKKVHLSICIYIKLAYVYMPTLFAFFNMPYIKIKQKDIQLYILVIFRLFTNLLRTFWRIFYMYIYISYVYIHIYIISMYIYTYIFINNIYIYIYIYIYIIYTSKSHFCVAIFVYKTSKKTTILKFQ